MLIKDNDATLISRAHHAGRNLRALAYLSLLAFALMTGVAVMAGKSFPLFWLLSLITLFLLAGYWLLSMAAKRGDPAAPGSAVLILVIFGVLQFVGGYFLSMNSTVESVQPVSPTSIIIPIVIIIMLLMNWNDLRELRKRGLLEQVFITPLLNSRRLCLIGAALLSVGYASLDGVMLYSLNQKVQEIQYAKAFLSLVEHEEKAFFEVMGSTQPDMAAVQGKLAALENQVALLQKTTPPDNKAFLEVLASYEAAVRQWRKVVAAKQGENADKKAIEQAIEKGNRLRLEACEKFNRHYAEKNAHQ